jgi:hypothetical protein
MTSVSVHGRLRFWPKYKKEVIPMRIREVLKLKEPDLSAGAGSMAADRTGTMLAPVQAPNRIVQDVFADADPNHGVTDDLLLAPDPSPTRPMTISPAHRRDLDFIKSRLARLPRKTEQ